MDMERKDVNNGNVNNGNETEEKVEQKVKQVVEKKVEEEGKMDEEKQKEQNKEENNEKIDGEKHKEQEQERKLKVKFKQFMTKGKELLSDRKVVAAIGIGVLAIFVLLGGIFWRLLLAAAAVVGMYEVKELYRGKNFSALNFAILFAGIVTASLFSVEWYLAALVLVFAVMAFRNNVEDYVFLASLWVVLPILFVTKAPIAKVVALLVTAWSVDTVAYYVGIYFGKRRGIFSASENKSLEGTLAGFVAGYVVWFVLSIWFFPLPWLHRFVYAAIVSFAALTGDLFESAVKRKFNVKDSSKLLGEHGGLLDRIDSVLFVLLVAKILRLI